MSHLSFEERYKILEGLEDGLSLNKIAGKIGRSHTSVAREILRNRFMTKEPSYAVFTCVYEPKCERHFVCGDKTCKRACRGCFEHCRSKDCPDYKPVQCKRIENAPYVCNGCEKTGNICRYPKYKYNPRTADVFYTDRLKESRKGISLTPEQMKDLDDLVSPLIKQGQSIQAIFMEHRDEIPCSERTLYRYVDEHYLSAMNMDLPRKVRFKPRRSHGDNANKRNKDPFTFGRTYNDFKQYVATFETDPSIVEMDLVVGGNKGKKVLLTLLFRSCSLMLDFLLPDKTQDNVIETLNKLCDAIGIEYFQKYFQVLLCDRGSEFANPYALECDRYGEIKTKVFYCDPYCSWQKGKLERNHEFIRYVLPKGQTFDNLTQKDITLLMNHINNYPRKELNERSPYELAKLLIDEKILEALKYHRIAPDDVILKPWLLK